MTDDEIRAFAERMNKIGDGDLESDCLDAHTAAAALRSLLARATKAEEERDEAREAWRNESRAATLWTARATTAEARATKAEEERDEALTDATANKGVMNGWKARAEKAERELATETVLHHEWREKHAKSGGVILAVERVLTETEEELAAALDEVCECRIDIKTLAAERDALQRRLDEAGERLTRPIIGFENRTPLEVFDIMCDRFRRFLSQEPSP